MKFIADVGFPASGVAALRDRGHDVPALAEENLQRLPDDEIVVLDWHAEPGALFSRSIWTSALFSLATRRHLQV